MPDSTWSAISRGAALNPPIAVPNDGDVYLEEVDEGRDPIEVIVPPKPTYKPAIMQHFSTESHLTSNPMLLLNI